MPAADVLRTFLAPAIQPISNAPDDAQPLGRRLAMNWSGCPLVTSRPGFISGEPALRDDPRMPADLVVENMDLGESAQDVVENYQLHTQPGDVLAIYEYAKRQRALTPAR